MGAACCVAAHGRTVTNRSSDDNLQRHVHCSPSWSFRWDNRGRVAGEETHLNVNCARDEGCGNNRLGVKFGATVEAAFASEEGIQLDGSRPQPLRNSPLSEGNSGTFRLQSSGSESGTFRLQSSGSESGTFRLQSSEQAIPQIVPERKEPSDSPSAAYWLSPSVPSLSSKSASPHSSLSHRYVFPPSSTPSRWHYRSPKHPLSRQVSETIIPKSPSFSISEVAPSWGNYSNGESSDGWSIPARRERWSFDSEASGLGRDVLARLSEPHPGTPSIDIIQTCGICTQLLTDRSSLGCGGHRLSYTNELAVVSVLTCGHVYHSECLEYMTPEIHKYDPHCPVCTLGERRAVPEKAMRAEMDPRAQKRSRKRVVSSDLPAEIVFDRSNSVSTRKPFLRRHFSFGAKTHRQFTNCHSIPRRGFFWARSSRD